MTVLLLPRHPASEPECFPMDFSAFSATHVCSSHAVRLTTAHNTHRGNQTYVALMAMVVTGLTSELKSRRRRTAFLTHSFLVSISVVCLFQPWQEQATGGCAGGGMEASTEHGCSPWGKAKTVTGSFTRGICFATTNLQRHSHSNLLTLFQKLERFSFRIRLSSADILNFFLK